MIRRAATRQDFLDFHGAMPPHAVRATVWEEDGEVLAMASLLKVADVTFLASDIKEGVDVPKIRVWKEALSFMKEVGPCVCETDESHEFLTRVGFKPTKFEGLYEWQV